MRKRKSILLTKDITFKEKVCKKSNKSCEMFNYENRKANLNFIRSSIFDVETTFLQ